MPPKPKLKFINTVPDVSHFLNLFNKIETMYLYRMTYMIYLFGYAALKNHGSARANFGKESLFKNRSQKTVGGDKNF